MVHIMQGLKDGHDRKKSCANTHISDRSYEVRDLVFIHIRKNKSKLWFGKGTKLSPHFIGKFEILDRIRLLAYHLALPLHLHRTDNVFHVSLLQNYIADETHTLH